MSTMKILCKRVMPFHLLFLPSFIIPHRYTSMDLTTAMVSLAMEESRVVRILSVEDVSTEITLEQGGSSKCLQYELPNFALQVLFLNSLSHFNCLLYRFVYIPPHCLMDKFCVF